MKRVITLLLCAALLTPIALAAGESADYATQLHDLGLFQGVEAGRFDEESMALDRPATRVEGITMLVRVLGHEAEAKALNADCPFSDVDDWAKPYVGYAYNRGLTMGKGGGQFGSIEPLALNQFTTMLLRAMGYKDSEDFTWNESEAFALELGLFGAAWLEGVERERIDRGGMVDLSWFALNTPQKDSSSTLLDEIKANSDPSEAARVVALVNEERAKEGLNPLVMDEKLTKAAQIRAVELATKFDHTRPDGASCFTVLKEVGLSYRSVGENIAKGQSSPEEVMKGWMNSSGHRENIMNSDFTEIGVGYVAETRSWVQLFRLP